MPLKLVVGSKPVPKRLLILFYVANRDFAKALHVAHASDNTSHQGILNSMRYSFVGAFGIMPTLDDHPENIQLLGIGFLIIIFALIAGAIIFNGFSKACSLNADRLEHKSTTRHKRRPTSFRKHQPPPLRVLKSDSAQTSSSLALHALRRNAEASSAHKVVTPSRTRPNIRLVKQQERA